MLAQLVRLNDTWPRWDTDDQQFERMSYSYHESLNDLDAEAVAGGVGVWIRTNTNHRWPSPAQVRECAVKWITANRDLRVRWKPEEGACAVCGAKPRWAELSARDWRTGDTGVVVRMIHPCDAERHGAGSPYVPFPPNFIRWAPPSEEHDAKASLTQLVAKFTRKAPDPPGTRPSLPPRQGDAEREGHDVRGHRGGDRGQPPAGVRDVPQQATDPVT